MAKKLTMEDLALKIEKGFEGQDKRFSKINRRLDRIDKRLYHIENVLLTDHRLRIERLEKKIGILE